MINPTGMRDKIVIWQNVYISMEFMCSVFVFTLHYYHYMNDKLRKTVNLKASLKKKVSNILEEKFMAKSKKKTKKHWNLEIKLKRSSLTK